MTSARANLTRRRTNQAKRAMPSVVKQCLVGAVNVVAPECADQARFAHAIAAARHARVHIYIPAALIRALGGEALTILLDGQAAAPRRLLSVGFRF